MVALDEVQTLPDYLLLPILSALRVLADRLGTTVLLGRPPNLCTGSSGPSAGCPYERDRRPFLRASLSPTGIGPVILNKARETRKTPLTDGPLIPAKWQERFRSHRHGHAPRSCARDVQLAVSVYLNGEASS